MDNLKSYELAFFEIYKGKDRGNLQSCFRSVVANLDESFITLVQEYNTLGHNDYGIEGQFSPKRDSFMDLLEELENYEINEETRKLKSSGNENLFIEKLKNIKRK